MAMASVAAVVAEVVVEETVDVEEAAEVVVPHIPMKTVSKSKEQSKSSKETVQKEEAVVAVEGAATTMVTDPLPAEMPLAAALMSKEGVAAVPVVVLKIVRKLYPLT